MGPATGSSQRTSMTAALRANMREVSTSSPAMIQSGAWRFAAGACRPAGGGLSFARFRARAEDGWMANLRPWAPR